MAAWHRKGIRWRSARLLGLLRGLCKFESAHVFRSGNDFPSFSSSQHFSFIISTQSAHLPLDCPDKRNECTSRFPQREIACCRVTVATKKQTPGVVWRQWGRLVALTLDITTCYCQEEYTWLSSFINRSSKIDALGWWLRSVANTEHQYLTIWGWDPTINYLFPGTYMLLLSHRPQYFP